MHQLRNKSKWPLARKEQEHLTFQLHLQGGLSLFIDSSEARAQRLPDKKAGATLIRGQKHSPKHLVSTQSNRTPPHTAI